MIKFIPVLSFLCMAFCSHAQKIDSIYFHLYTDSLKKGTYNYINIDAKLSNGRWAPITTKEITLNSTGGQFEGNDLFIPFDFKDDYVVVSATLKTNTSIKIERKIWIKTKADSELLPTKNDVMTPTNKKRR